MPTQLLSFKQVSERLGGGDKYARKVLKALEDNGSLHRFQPTKAVHPKWYASEVEKVITPPAAESHLAKVAP
jgi:hypothetical protein